ncbi:MAG: hypothetical protein ACMG6E_05795 [Candidatus Roizmanbacteria bacterium]
MAGRGLIIIVFNGRSGCEQLLVDLLFNDFVVDEMLVLDRLEVPEIGGEGLAIELDGEPLSEDLLKLIGRHKAVRILIDLLD